MSKHIECDECGVEINLLSHSGVKFGIAPTINRDAATKYQVQAKVFEHDSENQPDLCDDCLLKLIKEAVGTWYNGIDARKP